MNDKYEFSYPITYPTGDGYFHYTVEYQYTLKLRNGDFTTYGGADADYMRLIKEWFGRAQTLSCSGQGNPKEGWKFGDVRKMAYLCRREIKEWKSEDFLLLSLVLGL